jgi:hypothetical protein
MDYSLLEENVIVNYKDNFSAIKMSLEYQERYSRLINKKQY